MATTDETPARPGKVEEPRETPARPGGAPRADEPPARDPCCRAQVTEAARAFHERMFLEYVSDFLRTDPEFIERFDNFAFDEVPRATPGLDDRTRAIGWLATLVDCQGIEEFRAMLPAALELGVSPVEMKEVLYQAVAYVGIGRAFPFLMAANQALESRGVELPLPPQARTLPTRGRT